MRRNSVRQKLSQGSPVIGTFVGLQSANVAELMGHSGFDFVVIEAEHNALESAEIEHVLMALGNTNAVPIVRIPSSDKVFIQKALDLGATGSRHLCVWSPSPIHLFCRTQQTSQQCLDKNKWSFLRGR